jgi:hypothetical protein
MSPRQEKISSFPAQRSFSRPARGLSQPGGCARPRAPAAGHPRGRLLSAVDASGGSCSAERGALAAYVARASKSWWNVCAKLACPVLVQLAKACSEQGDRGEASAARASPRPLSISSALGRY